MELSKLHNDILAEILLEFRHLLLASKISAQKVSKIAKQIKAINDKNLPIAEYRLAIKNLATFYPELLPAISHIKSTQKQEQRGKVVNDAIELIKSGKFQQATALLSNANKSL